MHSVHYSGWSSRFDEWVAQSALVAATPKNYLTSIQQYRAAIEDRIILPAKLFVDDHMRLLHAALFLHHPHRNRGVRSPPRIKNDDLWSQGGAGIRGGTTERDESLVVFPASPRGGHVAQLRAALLYVEAALPMGCLDRKTWTDARAARWAWNVRHCREDPCALMELLIVLEQSIHSEWIIKSAWPTYKCVSSSGPCALALPSFSAVALRLWLLDASLQYDLIQIDNSSAFFLDPSKSSKRLVMMRKAGNIKKARGRSCVRPGSGRPLKQVTDASMPNSEMMATKSRGQLLQLAPGEKRGRGRPRKDSYLPMEGEDAMTTDDEQT